MIFSIRETSKLRVLHLFIQIFRKIQYKLYNVILRITINQIYFGCLLRIFICEFVSSTYHSWKSSGTTPDLHRDHIFFQIAYMQYPSIKLPKCAIHGTLSYQQYNCSEQVGRWHPQQVMFSWKCWNDTICPRYLRKRISSFYISSRQQLTVIKELVKHLNS